MIQRVVTIRNERGLHARAAAKLVKLTCRFESDIKLSSLDGDQKIDAKSILGILLLAARKGTDLRFTFQGPDEALAAESVAELIAGRFGEEK